MTKRLKPASILILLFISGCATNTVVSDFCLRDSLILPMPGDVKLNSVAEGEIIFHNARYECGCVTPRPEWCES